MFLFDLVFPTDKFIIPASKREQSEKISQDVQDFLDRGGKIKKLDPVYSDYVPKFVVAKQK